MHVYIMSYIMYPLVIYNCTSGPFGDGQGILVCFKLGYVPPIYGHFDRDKNDALVDLRVDYFLDEPG